MSMPPGDLGAADRNGRIQRFGPSPTAATHGISALARPQSASLAFIWIRAGPGFGGKRSVNQARFEFTWARWRRTRLSFLLFILALLAMRLASNVAAATATVSTADHVQTALAAASLLANVGVLYLACGPKPATPAQRSRWIWSFLSFWTLAGVLICAGVFTCPDNEDSARDAGILCADIATGTIPLVTIAVPIIVAGLGSGAMCIPARTSICFAVLQCIAMNAFVFLVTLPLQPDTATRIVLATLCVLSVAHIALYSDSLALAMVQTTGQWEKERQRMETAQQASLVADAARNAHEQTMGYILHEVRNPTHAACGALWMLRDMWPEGTPRALTRELDCLDAAVAQISSVVDDALDLQRLRGGRFPIRPVRTKIANVLRDVCNQINRMSPVPLALRVSPLVPATAFFDPARARQVLTNGLTNAAKLSSKVPILVLAYPVNSDGSALGQAGPSSSRSSGHMPPAKTAAAAAPALAGSSATPAPAPPPATLPAGTGAGASRVNAASSAGSSVSEETVWGDGGKGDSSRRYVCIQIVDGGPGLDTADVELLFHDFADSGGAAYREAQRARREAPLTSRSTDPRFALLYSTSTGLGLPLSRKVARALGGTLHLHDRRWLPHNHPLRATGPVSLAAVEGIDREGGGVRRGPARAADVHVQTGTDEEAPPTSSSSSSAPGTGSDDPSSAAPCPCPPDAAALAEYDRCAEVMQSPTGAVYSFLLPVHGSQAGAEAAAAGTHADGEGTAATGASGRNGPRGSDNVPVRSSMGHTRMIGPAPPDSDTSYTESAEREPRQGAAGASGHGAPAAEPQVPTTSAPPPGPALSVDDSGELLAEPTPQWRHRPHSRSGGTPVESMGSWTTLDEWELEMAMQEGEGQRGGVGRPVLSPQAAATGTVAVEESGRAMARAHTAPTYRPVVPMPSVEGCVPTPTSTSPLPATHTAAPTVAAAAAAANQAVTLPRPSSAGLALPPTHWRSAHSGAARSQTPSTSSAAGSSDTDERRRSEGRDCGGDGGATIQLDTRSETGDWCGSGEEGEAAMTSQRLPLQPAGVAAAGLLQPSPSHAPPAPADAMPPLPHMAAASSAPAAQAALPTLAAAGLPPAPSQAPGAPVPSVPVPTLPPLPQLAPQLVSASVAAAGASVAAADTASAALPAPSDGGPGRPRWPTGNGAAPAPAATASAADREDLSGLHRVLVVDDEPMNRRLLARMLERLGAPRVDTASDGDEAIEMVKQAHAEGDGYGLLLLDIIMRRVNGDDVLLQLDRTEHAVPAIACTGNAMATDIERYQSVGFKATLTKPFSIYDLGSTIRRTIPFANGPG